MKKLTIGAAVLVAIALTLTGCSKSTQAVTVGEAPSATTSAVAVEAGAKKVLTKEQANATLVTADQLGTGWVAGGTSTSTSTPEPGDTTFSPASCSFSASDGGLTGSAAIDPNKTPVAEATAEFHQAPTDGDAFNVNVHGVSVAVESYQDDLDESKLQEISKKLTECATFTSTDGNGVTSSWQVLPTSLPNYGDGTLAFRLQGTVSMFVILIDVVEIVSGHNLVTIGQTGLGKIDTTLAAHIAEQIMTNLDTATK
jgi:hypothetical protein